MDAHSLVSQTLNEGGSNRIDSSTLEGGCMIQALYREPSTSSNGTEYTGTSDRLMTADVTDPRKSS